MSVAPHHLIVEARFHVGIAAARFSGGFSALTCVVRGAERKYGVATPAANPEVQQLPMRGGRIGSGVLRAKSEERAVARTRRIQVAHGGASSGEALLPSTLRVRPNA